MKKEEKFNDKRKFNKLLFEESDEDNQAKKPQPNSNVVHIKTDEEIINNLWTKILICLIMIQILKDIKRLCLINLKVIFKFREDEKNSKII